MLNILSKYSSNSTFRNCFSFLGVDKLLKTCGFTRRLATTTKSIKELLLFAMESAFCHENVYRKLNSEKDSSICSFKKTTLYGFLADARFNWERLMMQTAKNTIDKLQPLTDHVSCFVVDDTMLPRNRAKNVELVARLFDHVKGKTIKAFCDLTLGWTDGISMVPVAHALMSSANKDNQVCPSKEHLDKRTLAFKRRQHAQSSKPDIVIDMLKRAIDAGIDAQYLLCDTWFTNAPLIKRLKQELKLNLIGMVKQLKQKYEYHNQYYTLPGLRKLIAGNNRTDIYGSIVVKIPSTELNVKIVFVRNRNKRSEFIYILSTDITLSNEEIVRIYSKRFLIEHCYYCMKHFFKFTTECQARNYDSCYAFSTLCYIRMIFLEWMRRSEEDLRTYGDLFYLSKAQLEDIPYAVAIKSLLLLFQDYATDIVNAGIATAKRAQAIQLMAQLKINNWLNSMTSFIQNFVQKYSILPCSVN